MEFENEIRGGTRGGKDQFKWEDIKNLKPTEREYYIGQSVKTQTNNWIWGMNKTSKKAKKEDLKRIQKQEEELMSQAL